MSTNLFLSHRMGSLVDRLVQYMEEHPVPPLTTRTILTPNPQIKQWLFLEIAKRKNIAMGLQFLEIEQLFPHSISSLEMFCIIYTEVSKSTDPDLQAYLSNKPQRILDLTGQLTSLFFSYGQYGKDLFSSKISGWQQEILHKLFLENSRRLPVQIEAIPEQPIICFGIDFMPAVYWEFLFKAPSLSIFLFSPCAEFWEDLCSDRERRNLNRYWKKRGATSSKQEELDAYLRNAPKNLANWGKLGRETLRLFDRFNLQTEENYPELEPDSALKQVQFGLLTFQELEEIKSDSSLKVFLTGSSTWKEVECLRDEILRLDVPFHEISILAPDIEPYIPLIEFVFADLIPYRISGFDLAPQSSFRQGLTRLVNLAHSRWDVEEVLTLLETPAFYRKQNWDEKRLEQFREWIAFARIQWGFNQSHREQMLSSLLGEESYKDIGSWEKGIDKLIDTLVYLLPVQINADQLEEFVGSILRLKKLPLYGKKTLSHWADCLELAVREFLVADSEDEADIAAQNSFKNVIQEFRDFPEETLFPFGVVQRLLVRPCSGQINSSQLHAVRIGSLEEGALIPSKALFLIGMSEEGFPRVKTGSSLDLLKGKAPDLADRDRYLFLQTIFSAQKYLRISYGHLSADEGKPVGPSLVVQELLSRLDTDVISTYRAPILPPQTKNFSWGSFKPPILPKGEVVINVSDLRALARHPWKFHLQKVLGIYLDEPLEESFDLQKGRLLRSLLEESKEEVELPRGRLGEALEQKATDEKEQLQAQMNEWGLESFSLILRENCHEKQFEGSDYIIPAIEIPFEDLTVRIVGEVKSVSMKGLICMKDDISSLLKVWPEALIAAIGMESPHVWAIKTGKCKDLQQPLESLKAFIEYYFCCLNAPSPLLSDWADALLRKGASELEKKMEKGSSFEDPVIDWVLERTEFPSADTLCQEWGPYLKDAFSALAALYPVRGKNHAAV